MTYTSEPIPTPEYDDDAEIARADLEFRGIDHSGASYEARIYLDNPEADETTGKGDGTGYVGSFWVFGHGGCFGDVGHCDVPADKAHAYDYRPPHPLLRMDRVVDVTEAVAALAREGKAEFTVTVVPIARTEAMPADDAHHEGHGHDHDHSLLQFDQLSLATYE
jgi:tyrosinase